MASKNIDPDVPIKGYGIVKLSRLKKMVQSDLKSMYQFAVSGKYDNIDHELNNINGLSLRNKLEIIRREESRLKKK